jgi:hypothetical protein
MIIGLYDLTSCESLLALEIACSPFAIHHGKPSVRLGCPNDDLALISLCEAVRKEGGVGR